MSLLTTTVLCLALNVYKEARGEPPAGQMAVAQVTLNRAAKQKKTACEVVKQRKQFSWTTTDLRNGKLKPSAMPDLKSKAWADSLQIARRALVEPDPTQGATFYHERRIRPYWAKHVAFVMALGNHRFYRERA